MKLRRLLVVCFGAFIIACSFATSAVATESAMADNTSVSNFTEESIEPRSDVIETKYRKTIDGRLQYRRWNATRGMWVDDDWIDLP